MKKIIILALGAITMVSCGNTYKAQDAVLIDQNDSINYALGLVNGMSLYMQQISKLEEKEADKAVTEFMDALQSHQCIDTQFLGETVRGREYNLLFWQYDGWQ